MSRKSTDGGAGIANADYDWDSFDAEAYFQHHYSKIRQWDDEPMARLSAAHFSTFDPMDDVIDVGTGTNLYPILSALPRAKRITAFEYGAQNIHWLREELQRKRIRSVWLQFWAALKDEYPDAEDLPDSPTAWLRERVKIEQGSIFDLPERRYDGGTMFFCAESITKSGAEFALACRRFARSIKKGGPIVAAFMEGSSGYPVGSAPFPAYFLRDEEHLREAVAGLVTSITITRFASDPALRGGYKGMLLLCATSA